MLNNTPLSTIKYSWLGPTTMVDKFGKPRKELF
jgi:hypothetical protein